MKINPRQSKQKSQSGMTLIELVIVIIVLSILVATGSAQIGSTNEMMLSQQAKKFASQIRHAQFLATNWGCDIKLTMTASKYEATYQTTSTAEGKADCISGNIVNDPASFDNLSITLENSASFTGGTIFYFDNFGRPKDSATDVLLGNINIDMTTGTSTWRITINSLTGFVSSTAL